MFCYVGRATKIFFMVVAVLVMMGLVVGFTRVVHHAGAHKVHGCNGAKCQPTTIPSPIPIPNTIPAATTAAVPPTLSPPSPDYVVQGPVHALTQPNVG